LLTEINSNDAEVESSKISTTATTATTAQKEVKILKQMIKILEDNSFKDKTSFQKQLSKKKEEIDFLKLKLEESKDIERNLRHQLDTIKNELAINRRNNLQRVNQRARSLSKEIPVNRNSRHNSSSVLSNRSANVTTTSNHRSRLYSSKSNSGLNNIITTTTTDRRDSYRQSNNASPANSIASVRSNYSNTSNGSKSFKKFDPTEYIQNKNRHLKEIELKRFLFCLVSFQLNLSSFFFLNYN
jgi:hypothetical protein